MSEFTDRIRNSEAVSNLRECIDLLPELALVDWDIAEARDLITRLTLVTENILGRLTIADRNLVPGSILGELEGQSQNLLALIQRLKDSAPSVPINLPDADNNIDEILSTASLLPVLPIRTTSKVLEKAAEQFDREANSAKALISTEVESLHSEMANFREEVRLATTDFSNRAAELEGLVNQRFAEAQNTNNALQERANEATERLERGVTNIQEVFRASQNERDTAFIEAQGQRIAEFTEAQETRDREFHDRLDPILEDMESFRDQAKKMLEEVAGASSAEHYAKQRDSQKKNADLWRWIGVTVLFALVVMSGYIFFDTRSAGVDFSAAWLVARSGILVSLGVFAGYAFRQSGQHRRREEAVDRVANELILLWPFIGRLPDDDRELLLREITPLYFKGGLSGGDSTEQANMAERIRSAITQRGRN